MTKLIVAFRNFVNTPKNLEVLGCCNTLGSMALLGIDGLTYLLLRYVDRFVDDDPRDRLMTGWHCCRSVIRHIIICIRHQTSYGQPFHLHLLSCQIDNYS